ncbi:DNA-directed RNA polymerase subunit omega [Hydrogenivirga caldilitoris]|uniref:DNA-directed RNA polymerase subunit omega n=1 Tax=Hydrogenivirga caldilitoris TaxID=246264 RepID=A0A497XPC7_9AQUI|nr:DNA-directed RNA polymerase subunit omega [Hydrogenivirga caldilitoris]RLJ69990.1 DNA-directed RNA polymerase subunit omega [Hydrogenivirga caldilitoris]
MSRRPDIEGALKKVSSRYELVHAAVKRTLQLLQEGDDFFIRGERELIKKTFQSIEDIAKGKAKIVRRD